MNFEIKLSLLDQFCISLIGKDYYCVLEHEGKKYSFNFYDNELISEYILSVIFKYKTINRDELKEKQIYIHKLVEEALLQIRIGVLDNVLIIHKLFSNFPKCNNLKQKNVPSFCFCKSFYEFPYLIEDLLKYPIFLILLNNTYTIIKKIAKKTQGKNIVKIYHWLNSFLHSSNYNYNIVLPEEALNYFQNSNMYCSSVNRTND